MKKYGILILCIATTCLATIASVYAADPVSRLAHIDAFAFGGIGVAGTPSDGEIEFREIYASSTVASDFKRLLGTGNRQAKCYALAALHKLDPEAFPGFAAPFENDRAQVHTISGCAIMDMPMSAVVAAIAKGRYDASIDRKLHRP